MKRSAYIAIAALCAWIVPTLLVAQSVNIDLGHPTSAAPDAGYRAAGMPGVWNKIDALTTGFEYPLVGLDGQPIAGTFDQFGGTEIQDVPLADAGDPTHSDRLFMKDALITHTSIENCLFFASLQSGTYEVLTYAWMPSQPTVLNKVRVDFNPTQTNVGGNWTGSQIEGVTYARHFVQVSTGFLGTHSGVPSGGDFGIGAAMNGVQIRRLVAEVPAFAERDSMSWLSSLNANAYDIVQGDLALLRSSKGDFVAATTACLADSVGGNQATYGPDPDPGVGQWFLVRGVTPTASETYNAPGTGQIGDRDIEISLAGATCP